jgi:hypothetical protein
MPETSEGDLLIATAVAYALPLFEGVARVGLAGWFSPLLP